MPGAATSIANDDTAAWDSVRYLEPAAIRIGFADVGGLDEVKGVISVAHLLWFAVVARCFSAASVRERLLAVRHWIDRVFGAVLVSLGLALAVSRNA